MSDVVANRETFDIRHLSIQHSSLIYQGIFHGIKN